MHFDEGMLQTYLDNQLSYEERATVEAHLKECVLCREKLECLAGQERIACSSFGSRSVRSIFRSQWRNDILCPALCRPIFLPGSPNF